jgi:hypothetical protein
VLPAFHGLEYRRAARGWEKVAGYPPPVFPQGPEVARDLFSESVFDPRVASGFSAGSPPSGGIVILRQQFAGLGLRLLHWLERQELAVSDVRKRSDLSPGLTQSCLKCRSRLRPTEDKTPTCCRA